MERRTGKRSRMWADTPDFVRYRTSKGIELLYWRQRTVLGAASERPEDLHDAEGGAFSRPLMGRCGDDGRPLHHPNEYRTMLKLDMDDGKRSVLTRLIAEAKANLARANDLKRQQSRGTKEREGPHRRRTAGGPR
jgi:hypothetical protein